MTGYVNAVKGTQFKKFLVTQWDAMPSHHYGWQLVAEALSVVDQVPVEVKETILKGMPSAAVPGFDEPAPTPPPAPAPVVKKKRAAAVANKTKTRKGGRK